MSKKVAIFFLGIFLCSFFCNSSIRLSHAGFEPRGLVKTGIGANNFASGTKTYRIGEEWGKHNLTEEELSDPIISQLVKAIAYTNTATSFYVGYHNGEHVMATNYHVMTASRDCRGADAYFPMFERAFPCKRFIGSWSDIDFALFVIEVDSDVEWELELAAVTMAFDEDQVPGTQLVTIGFGVANNPQQDMQINYDSDCIVFSDEGDYRFMADPDDLNPASYSVWSFAHGCDISHGDSGSPVFNASTGKAIGLNWTGRIPKSSIVQNEASLNHIFEARSEEIWTELSYGVSAVSIKEFLIMASASMPKNDQALIDSFLGLK